MVPQWGAAARPSTAQNAGPPTLPPLPQAAVREKAVPAQRSGKEPQNQRQRDPHPENIPQDAQSDGFPWVQPNQGKWLHCSGGLTAETSRLKASRGMKGRKATGGHR